MEKINASSDKIRETRKRFAWTVGRFSLKALLAPSVILAGLMGTALFFPILNGFTVSAVSRDRTAPSAPSNLRITGSTASSVSLAWNASTDNSGTFSYRVRNSWGFQATASQTQTSFIWTSNLIGGQTYSFYVYAIDAAGNRSRDSNTVTITLPRDTVPPTTPAIVVTDIGPTHISLAWASTGGGPTLRYWIFKDGQLDRQPTPDTSGTFYLLEPETTHTFAVQARDGTNASLLSPPVTVSTEPINPNDTTPPTMPTNFRQSHYQGESEVSLSWGQSTDDLDPQTIIRYDVYVNGVLDDIKVGSGRSTVYVVEGLNTITLVAVDTAGNESPETSITFFFF
jgi:chitodextrinase